MSSSAGSEEALRQRGVKSRRPADSKFKQQRLAAWRPILTPASVLPWFALVGVAFIITGAVLLAENKDVQEMEFDYTDCASTADPSVQCKDVLSSNSSFTDRKELMYRCTCDLVVPVKGFIGKKVYLYYGLDNFYQNHRRYVKSRSNRQLRGKQENGGVTCEPLLNNGSLAYAPCGLVANSIFNDTILIQKRDPSQVIPMTGKGIAWSSDVKVMFSNPPTSTDDICDAPFFSSSTSIPPPNWPVPACKLGENFADVQAGRPLCTDTSAENGITNCIYNPWYSDIFNSSGRGYENEDFIVWMRVAALPDFRKLWRIVESGGFDYDGDYTFKIDYNFPVADFGGRKKIILTTTNAIGGDNTFLPGCYLAVGILSVLSAAVFFVVQQQGGYGRKLGDVTDLHWHEHVHSEK
eukprot:m.195568 g.195568  ORF g.195568 m.195568 type:complete len:408 (-) comp18679_c0_seq3:175-1398(-)